MFSSRQPFASFCRHALFVLLLPSPWVFAVPSQRYEFYVTNEKSGDVTIIRGKDFKVAGTIPVGKRPRGIHASPDGRTIYVALSGTPVRDPPALDGNGSPILKKKAGDDDDDDADAADKAADGIGVVDVASGKLVRKLPAGSDPEEFDISTDGTRLYVSNEDVKTASVINVDTAQVEHIVLIGQEPEGVSTAPDGKSFYVTCESGGDVFVISTANYAPIAQFKVPVRPRSVAFLPGSPIAFIPSESVGKLNVVDTAKATVINTITLPSGSRPMRVRVAPDGGKLYVSNGRAGTVSVLDAHSYALLDSIKVGSRPWGIALSPDGKYLLSANGPSNDVSVVDLSTDKEVARVKVGERPWGIAVLTRQN
jgi:YVTN family beta-propeller protein